MERPYCGIEVRMGMTATVEPVDHFFQRCELTVVHVGRCLCDISERRSFERTDICVVFCEFESAQFWLRLIHPNAGVVILFVGKIRPAVTVTALRAIAEEQRCAAER